MSLCTCLNLVDIPLTGRDTWSGLKQGWLPSDSCMVVSVVSTFYIIWFLVSCEVYMNLPQSSKSLSHGHSSRRPPSTLHLLKLLGYQDLGRHCVAVSVREFATCPCEIVRTFYLCITTTLTHVSLALCYSMLQYVSCPHLKFAKDFWSTICRFEVTWRQT